MTVDGTTSGWVGVVAVVLGASPPAGPGAAIRLLNALLTDLLIVENREPIDLVNAEPDVMSVTRTVSTPSMLPAPRTFVSLTVEGPPVTSARLLVTVWARDGGWTEAEGDTGRRSTDAGHTCCRSTAVG